MDSSQTTTGLACLAAAEDARRSSLHDQLFRRVIGRIHRYFWRLLRDAQEAEECTQRTLVELESTLRDGRFEAGRSFNTWTFLKAHKVYCGWLRERERARRTQPLPAGLQQKEAVPTEDRLDARTLLARLQTELGDEVYECFVLQHEAQLSQEEVAAVLGCSRRTVVRRLKQARTTFQKWRRMQA